MPGPVLPRASPVEVREPHDWRWQLRNAVGTADDLARALPLTARELEGARRAEQQGLPLRITPYYLSLADRDDPACPVRRQCVPDAREGATVPGDLADPLGICSSANSANVRVDVSVDIISIISGNWESLTTWNIGRVPLSTDKVVIDTTHNVTITTNNAHAKLIQCRGTGKIIFSTVSGKLYLGL